MKGNDTAWSIIIIKMALHDKKWSDIRRVLDEKKWKVMSMHEVNLRWHYERQWQPM